MEFKVSELEREPIEFDLELKPGAINFGDEAEQKGGLATSGRAEVIHEHRGPKEIVPDIRLKGRFAGAFRIPCARCLELVEVPLSGEFDLIFRPVGADGGAPERSISLSETDLSSDSRRAPEAVHSIEAIHVSLSSADKSTPTVRIN